MFPEKNSVIQIGNISFWPVISDIFHQKSSKTNSFHSLSEVHHTSQICLSKNILSEIKKILSTPIAIAKSRIGDLHWENTIPAKTWKLYRLNNPLLNSNVKIAKQTNILSKWGERIRERVDRNPKRSKPSIRILVSKVVENCIA